ncbi:Asp-tRNA(Asn)/Glu-tRNA(Gln) amidotransferase subunit GatB [Chryseotalea sanaruensis]|nr:Asp-tRNA(Asn)/Glu-tRNA(Gln) amidotransferase subunit GatB [Chryseotalea sanaruensis]
MLKESIRDKYKVVIGLEVHAQLSTVSKIFSSESVSFGGSPNTNISVVNLAHPGTLPKLNKKALEYAIKMGLVCQSKISRYNIFDRKNYFYPDLPKGYQLTQDRTPICIGGYVPITLKDGRQKDIILNRIHLEEDAGKLIHDQDSVYSLVDLNRAGTPLIEIVTEPVLSTSEEAAAFLTEVRQRVRYLDICDGNMEEGSLRCDANISIMLKDAKTFGKKVEIKNMNSIRYVQKAIDFEIERQIEEVERGNSIISETRMFDITSGKTYGMRAKEELNDYRYFPDPDLSPVIVSEEWLNSIMESLPLMAYDLHKKFTELYGLPQYDAQVLTDSKEIALYFEELCQRTKHYKAASNWMMGPVKAYLKTLTNKASEIPVRPVILAELIDLVEAGKLSFSIASQQVFPVLAEKQGTSALEVAQQLNVLQESDTGSLMPIIEEVINSYPQKVAEYKSGKKGIIAMFMGEVMKRSKGKADPKLASELLSKKLEVL